MPTNVSTSFFFINLLFQARRAGSNPRPSCVPRCVAARDKSRPWRRAMARAHQKGCARSRPSAWVLNSRCVAARDKSRPWRRAYGPRSSRGLRTCAGCSWSGIGKAWHTSWCVAARDKSRPWRRAMARAHQEGCARARGVVGRGLEGLSHGGSLAGRSASGLVKIPALDGGKALCWGFLSRLGGAETVLSGTVSSLAFPKNWMQKTQEYQ